MTGLRRRVVAGFISLVGVLVLSGTVSFIELSVLSNEIGEILDTNNEYNELARELKDAAAMHSNAFMQLTAFGNNTYERQCNEAARRVEQVISSVQSKSEEESAELNNIAATALQLQAIVSGYTARTTMIHNIDSTMVTNRPSRALEAYNRYHPTYNKMLLQIEEYERSAHSGLTPSAVQLQDNAYRAVIPVFLSLVVMIAFVLMLFYFMLIYCVNPVVAINNSLKSYIEFKVPFAPSSKDNRDEMQELSDRIELLTQQNNKLITKE